MFLPVGDDIEHKTLPMTGIILVLINLLVYSYELRLYLENPHHPVKLIDFVDRWGLTPADLQNGSYVQLVTHMFLHGDAFHLLGNMIVLWAFVRGLENLLGSTVFVSFYLIWGILAGVAQSAMDWDSQVPMIGASGAIAAMIGAYFIAFGARANVKTLVFIFFRPFVLNIPAGFYVFTWICFQLAGQAAEAEQGDTGVAWMAHLGGFGIGAAMMLLVGKNTRRHLVRLDDGTLEIKDANASPTVVPAAPQRSDLPQGPHVSTEQPTHCAHCGAPFTDESRLAETMLRCVNPQCQRLTLLG
jgi:membrane associated rhomboid family serine protease